ncbi:hypothetical protein M427DRAFT_50544 [Gonapodya prolifera JEL478]|uniref:NADH dehydrogenase [ubiquinone] 1 alpha subcomplex subunit 13 n=1 Tax=Gonapodya prolifera (strain JEL478) TaxID=1344416 RepID=A0A139AZN0_GONPJ|nr:hypothetical protein M427DRAFT_50544 [Gonapodya prolifera JEL478]|eukprot:KXS22196.1 hypothetical protein M427DRAFT_50544 [Gonapodya prolifera JEL478]
MAAPPRQDLPPPGGFAPVRFARNLPKKGPSGAFLFLAGGLVSGWGFMKIGELNAERRELRREKTWSRIHLVPILQAETDRDTVRRMDALASREAEIMQQVDGFVPGSLTDPVPGLTKEGKFAEGSAEPVYHTKRYVSPSLVYVDDDDKEVFQRAKWNAGTKVADI